MSNFRIAMAGFSLSEFPDFGRVKRHSPRISDAEAMAMDMRAAFARLVMDVKEKETSQASSATRPASKTTK